MINDKLLNVETYRKLMKCVQMLRLPRRMKRKIIRLNSIMVKIV